MLKEREMNGYFCWNYSVEFMDLIITGVITGFILSIMIGPVFFVLLETSIRRGVKAAIAFDIGVLMNDIVYILIAYLFYNQVSELSEGQDNSIVRLVGGGLFLIYGISNFFKKCCIYKLNTFSTDFMCVNIYILSHQTKLNKK